MEEHKENWASGMYLGGQSNNDTLLKNAVAIGYCSAMQDILDISWEDTNEQ